MNAVGYHLAELNLGVLKHDWDDPRVQGFVDGLEPVNRLAQRSKGFVWMMPEERMEFEQTHVDGAMGANPRLASTLSVWEDLASLKHFVWNTIHKRFYDRRAEWYDETDALRFAMWRVPVGHVPSMKEGMQRFRHLETHGDSDFAFGWDYAKRFWPEKDAQA